MVVSNICVFFCPENRGHDPIWRAYFSDGLKPPTRFFCCLYNWLERNIVCVFFAFDRCVLFLLVFSRRFTRRLPKNNHRFSAAWFLSKKNLKVGKETESLCIPKKSASLWVQHKCPYHSYLYHYFDYAPASMALCELFRLFDPQFWGSIEIDLEQKYHQ